MRLVLIFCVLSLVWIAPAAARPPVIATGSQGPVLDGPNTTNLDLRDADTLAVRSSGLTVPGLAWSLQASPDGTQTAILSRSTREIGFSPQPYSTVAFTTGGAAIELPGDVLAAVWTDPSRLVVLTDRGAQVPARVSAIDTQARTVVDVHDLDSAPGDAIRIGDRFAVVDTNYRFTERTITPKVRIFAADGSQERVVSLRRLGRGRLTYVRLARQGGRLVAYASASGRLATITPATGAVTVRRTRLRSQTRTEILDVSGRRVWLAIEGPNRDRIYGVDRRTGRTGPLLCRCPAQTAGIPGGWVSADFDAGKLRRYDRRGRKRWSHPVGRYYGPPVRFLAGRLYALDVHRPLKLAPRTGKVLAPGVPAMTYPGLITESDGRPVFPLGLGAATATG